MKLNFKNSNNKTKILVVVFSLIIIAFLVVFNVIPLIKYKIALEEIEELNYLSARERLISISGFKDSVVLLKDVEYNIGIQYYNQNKFEESILQFKKNPNYKDSNVYLENALRGKANQLFLSGDYSEVVTIISSITQDKSDLELLDKVNLNLSKEAAQKGDYQLALLYLKKIKNTVPDYKEVSNGVYYSYAKKIIDSNDNLTLEDLNTIYSSLILVDKDYLDTNSLIENYKSILVDSTYLEAVRLFNTKFFYEARQLFNLYPNYSETQNYLDSIYYRIEGSYTTDSDKIADVIISIKPNKGIEYYHANIESSTNYIWNENRENAFGIKGWLDQSSEILSYTDNVLTIKTEFGYIEKLYKVNDNILHPTDKPLFAPELGMTPDQVRQSYWGNPLEINKLTTIYGISEQWVYTGYRYIYFEDGIVISIQE